MSITALERINLLILIFFPNSTVQIGPASPESADRRRMKERRIVAPWRSAWTPVE